jgi:hypothetical protein
MDGDNAVIECQPDFELNDLLSWQKDLCLWLLLLGESYVMEDSDMIGPIAIGPTTDKERWRPGLVLTLDPMIGELQDIRIGFFLLRGESCIFDNSESQTVTIA